MRADSFKLFLLLCVLVGIIVFPASRTLASAIEGPPLSIYENNTMLFGLEDNPNSGGGVFKFQISGKLKIVDLPLYFAYTQRSFMDITKYSVPFYDHNYKPEFFYVQKIHGKKILKALQYGLVHWSNGKDGLASRSWNYAYLQLHLKKKNFYARPIFRIPFLVDEDNNADIEQFYGYLALRLGYQWHNNVEFSSHVRIGSQFNRYSIQNDLNLPWNVIFGHSKKKFVTSLWLQTYYGYGETLISYNQLSQSVALGLGIRD